MQTLGTVKWFNNAKGFGFIQPDNDGSDVFAHFSAIQMDGFRTLKPGARVRFELTQGDKGAQAQNIEVIPSDETSESPRTAENSSIESVPLNHTQSE